MSERMKTLKIEDIMNLSLDAQIEAVRNGYVIEGANISDIQSLASCPTSIVQGTSKNISLSPAGGTPPYTVYFIVDSTIVQTWNNVATNAVVSRTHTFNETVGNHVYKATVVDSCSSGQLTYTDPCTINITAPTAAPVIQDAYFIMSNGTAISGCSLANTTDTNTINLQTTVAFSGSDVGKLFHASVQLIKPGSPVPVAYTGDITAAASTTFTLNIHSFSNLTAPVDAGTWSIGTITIFSGTSQVAQASNLPNGGKGCSSINVTAVACATLSCTSITVNSATCPVTVASGSTFTIAANTSGGKAPLAYSWTRNSSAWPGSPTGQSFSSSLADGTYNAGVTVTDSCTPPQSCTATCTFTVGTGCVAPTVTLSIPT